MTRSHVVVVDPKAPADLLEYDLEGRAGTFLVELLELAEAHSALEWIQIGEGTLVERILARRPPAPSPEKLAKAQVNARFYRAQVRAKAPKAKAKYPSAKRRRKCPHCGELFASRGLGPHVFSKHTNREEFMRKVRRIAQAKHEAWLAKQAAPVTGS